MNKRIENILILASVFVTGTCFLVVEIIAIRMLSPFFGNTIYTTSSVIGTVLAALSLGYYIGGRISDKYPELRIFYGIIFISGLLVILAQIISVVFLPIFYLSLSIALGPFISSVLLFFIPSFSLGMLSPFAIKLYEKSSDKNNELGSHSGKILFWSTVGSITGSFMSGFVLIPYFGISNIMIGTGLILSCWGLLWFLIFYKKNPKDTLILMLVPIIGLTITWIVMPTENKNFIYEKDGLYERIVIGDREWEGRQTRFLYQDRSWSSAMYLDSDELVFDYTKYYELYKLFKPNPEKIFLIGGGAYSIPKAILKDSPNTNVYVSEIEPLYFELAKKYFNLKESDNLKNFTEDGRRILTKSNDKYDAIISDVYYSIFAIPMHFTTREFFELAKEKLSEDGVFIGNFVGNLEQKNPSFMISEIKTFKEIFDNSYFFAVQSPDSTKGQNIIFLGINGSKKIDLNSPEIKNSKNPIISNLSEKEIDINRFNLSEYSILTDDFAPVDYLVGKDINKFYKQ